MAMSKDQENGDNDHQEDKNEASGSETEPKNTKPAPTSDPITKFLFSRNTEEEDEARRQEIELISNEEYYSSETLGEELKGITTREASRQYYKDLTKLTQKSGKFGDMDQSVESFDEDFEPGKSKKNGKGTNFTLTKKFSCRDTDQSDEGSDEDYEPGKSMKKFKSTNFTPVKKFWCEDCDFEGDTAQSLGGHRKAHRARKVSNLNS